MVIVEIGVAATQTGRAAADGAFLHRALSVGVDVEAALSLDRAAAGTGIGLHLIEGKGGARRYAGDFEHAVESGIGHACQNYPLPQGEAVVSRSSDADYIRRPRYAADVDRAARRDACIAMVALRLRRDVGVADSRQIADTPAVHAVGIHQLAHPGVGIAAVDEYAVTPAAVGLDVFQVPVVGLLQILRAVNVDGVAIEALYFDVLDGGQATANVDAITRTVLRPSSEVAVGPAGS